MATTGYRAVPFTSFGKGLNLTAGVDAVDPAECIDCLNVTFSPRGAVGQRKGYAKLTTAALTNAVDSLSPFYTTGGTKQLLAGCGTRLEAISSSGSVVASATALSGGPWGFVSFGTPNSELAYAGNGTDTLRKWDGSSWSAPTAYVDSVAAKALPKARYLAVDNDSNRLVAAGFSTTSGGPNGTTSSPSHVYFSEPGQVEGDATHNAWDTSNFVELRPGDGEKIQGVAVFQRRVYVFKETCFFVFTGETTDNVGDPVFQYYAVETGIGLASTRALTVGRDGIYFLDRSGLYRTTGGPPELLSSAIEPIFTGSTSIYYQSSALNQAQITNAALAWYDERLYLAIPTTTSTNDRLLVFDPRYGWWSLWDIPCSALTTFRPSAREELVFGYPTGTNDIGRYYESSSYTSDNMTAAGAGGTKITSRWRSGWFDYQSPWEKTIRESKVWGEGAVYVGLSSDYDSSTLPPSRVTMSAASPDTWGAGSGSDTWGGGTNSSDLWGPVGAIGPTFVDQDISGTHFSVVFSNGVQNQTWVVHRFEPHLRESRPPSILEH